MKIIIPGVPIPQKRHRYTVNNQRKIWTYDPVAREKVIVRQKIMELLAKQEGPFKRIPYPDIFFAFYMPIPKYMRKGPKEHARKEQLRHTPRPDIDNLVKFYLDCMTKTFFDDDKTAWILGATKLYSPEPRTEIIILEGQLVLSECKIQHDDPETLKCDTPNLQTMDIPPYSETPLYSDIPQLADTYNDWKNRNPPLPKAAPVQQDSG